MNNLDTYDLNFINKYGIGTGYGDGYETGTGIGFGNMFRNGNGLGFGIINGKKLNSIYKRNIKGKLQ